MRNFRAICDLVYLKQLFLDIHLTALRILTKEKLIEQRIYLKCFVSNEISCVKHRVFIGFCTTKMNLSQKHCTRVFDEQCNKCITKHRTHLIWGRVTFSCSPKKNYHFEESVMSLLRSQKNSPRELKPISQSIYETINKDWEKRSIVV